MTNVIPSLVACFALAAAAELPPKPADAAAGPAAAAVAAPVADAAAVAAPVADAAAVAAPVADAAAVAAPVADAAPTDAALLHALIELLTPDDIARRAAGAAQLGALADPRAIPPLAHALRDPAAAVRAAAAIALGHQVTPASESALASAALRGADDPALSVAALQALGLHGGASAGNRVRAVYIDEEAPLLVRRAAETVLAERSPALLAATGRVSVVEGSGRLILVPAAGLFGAIGLGLVGSLGESEVAIPVGIVGGLVLGAGGGYLLTEDRAVTPAHGLLFASAGAFGTPEGSLLAGASSARATNAATDG